MARISRFFTIPFILVSSSCSTITFLPREGTASKFNLATVEYVRESTQMARQELVQEISAKMQVILDSLLVEDRAKIDALDSLLAEHRQKMIDVAASNDSTKLAVERVSAKLLRDMSEIRTATNTMQMYVDSLKLDMEVLPVEALRELNRLLEEYLSEKTQSEE